MPYVPSIGDIINLGFLIKDLIRALEETRGSSAEYQNCIRKLQALDEVVREVETLCNRSQGKIITQSSAQRESLLCIAYQCKRWIENVLASLKKYGPSLRKGGSGNSVRDALVKIRWRALRSDELAKIEMEVVYFCSVFSSHMSTATIHLLERNERTLQAGLASIGEVIFLMNDDRRLLRDIKHQSHENNRLVRSSTSSTTAKITESLDWIQNLSTEFNKLSQNIFVIPWLICKLFSSSLSHLPSHLERRLYQEPLYLRDSHGRITPIPLDSVDSWNGFQAILDERFRGVHGHKVVQNKRYVLHEAAANRDIEPWRPWECAFKAGQKIVMCIIIVDYTGWLTCPLCFLDSPARYDTEIECTDCGMRYRKESDPYVRQRPRATTKFNGNHASRTARVPASTTSKKRRLEFNPDDDAASFKCVRIVNQNRFEPGRSRERWVQQFNDAITYMRSSRNAMFERRPEVLDRYIRNIRNTYRNLGYNPAKIDGIVEELLTADPKISVISAYMSSASNSNLASSPDTSLSQGPWHKRRKIMRARPFLRYNVRAGDGGVGKPTSRATSGSSFQSGAQRERKRFLLAPPSDVKRIKRINV